MVLLNYVKNSFLLYLFDKNSIEEIEKKVSWKQAFFITWIMYILCFLIYYFYLNELDHLIILKDVFYLLFFLIILFPIFLLGIYWILNWIFQKLDGKNIYDETIKLGMSILFIPLILFFCIFSYLTFVGKEVSIYSLIVIVILESVVGIWMFIVSLNVFSYLQKINKIKVFFVILGLYTIIFFVFVIIVRLWSFFLIINIMS